jgi:hypothetical protein
MTALTAAHNNQIVNGGGGRGIGNGAQQSQNSEWERGGERWRRIKQSWSMVIIWCSTMPCQKNFHPLTKIWRHPIPVRGWKFFVRVICLHLPTWALYVSTLVLLVLAPMYVHADMLATHENDTTLTGQKWNKKGRCCRMLGRHFPTCLRHVVQHRDGWSGVSFWCLPP